MPVSLDVLARLGWDDQRLAELGGSELDERLVGRVARVDRGACDVLTGGGLVRADADRHTLVVGDWVTLVPDATDVVVSCLLTRRSAFVRQQAAKATADQPIAANIDTVLCVNALDVRVNPRRLERYLTVAWQSGATPVVLLTKADRSKDPAAAAASIAGVALGVTVHVVSALTGQGLEDLAPYVAPGQTVVLLGPSGTGKSTLVNRLLGHEQMSVAETRGDGKGRHTTTHGELVLLPQGGVLIDTPGMRGLRLWDAAEGIGRAFNDIDELATGCRFNDCAHDREPGCAVRAAIEAGVLPPARLDSRRKLERELRFMDGRRDALARSERQREWRVINRENRRRQRSGPR